MTPVIRIDDEVMEELKKRAVNFGFVFEPPNTTIRIILGLDSKVRTGGGGGGKKFPQVHTINLINTKYAEVPYKDTGMTFKQAWASNSDRNWRFAIRKEVLKAEGLT